MAPRRRTATHALAFMSVVACRDTTRAEPAPVSPEAAAAEAAKLAALLPPQLGTYAATGPATTSAGGGPITARRSYGGAVRVEVQLATGDVRVLASTLDSDAEHAFGSDTPTYWRTTTIAGQRTRVGEERPTVRSSTCLVRVGPHHIAEVRVAPATRAGECLELASKLDLPLVAATGGVPSPPRERR